MALPFDAQGINRMAEASQMPLDHEGRDLDQTPILEWASADDAPWHPKTIIDPQLEAMSAVQEIAGTLQPESDSGYRPPNGSNVRAFSYHGARSDSGYGTATRRSVGNASVYSVEVTEHEQECRSFIEPSANDQPFYPIFNEFLHPPRDSRTNVSWYPAPAVTNPDVPSLECPFCQITVKTKSELKYAQLRFLHDILS